MRKECPGAVFTGASLKMPKYRVGDLVMVRRKKGVIHSIPREYHTATSVSYFVKVGANHFGYSWVALGECPHFTRREEG